VVLAGFRRRHPPNPACRGNGPFHTIPIKALADYRRVSSIFLIESAKGFGVSLGGS
jgi:hypothetical protein